MTRHRHGRGQFHRRRFGDTRLGDGPGENRIADPGIVGTALLLGGARGSCTVQQPERRLRDGVLCGEEPLRVVRSLSSTVERYGATPAQLSTLNHSWSAERCRRDACAPSWRRLALSTVTSQLLTLPLPGRPRFAMLVRFARAPPCAVSCHFRKRAPAIVLRTRAKGSKCSR